MNPLESEWIKFGVLGMVILAQSVVIRALWSRVVTTQGEVLTIAREAVTAQRDGTAELHRLVDAFRDDKK